jgi:cyclophilin family peptidyl-prolyl cis-trans isomerase
MTFMKVVSALVVFSSFTLAAHAEEAAKTKAAETKKTEAAKPEAKKGDKVNPHVVIETSMGQIEIELFQEQAPISTKNFLEYVEKGFYNGTIFHRVINNFMIQGGGFNKDMSQKPTAAPIKNEATNGLKNEKYTLAMARTSVVDSATAQFFINVKDNDFLNHSSPTPQGYGYAVFGKVVSGQDVVDKIRAVPTGTKAGMQDVPSTVVEIKTAKRK